MQRWASKVQLPSDWRGEACWSWTASAASEYGYFWSGKAQVGAHRFAYERFVGPIPDGLVIDHLCRNPKCVNPSHLEPVPNGVNVLRGKTLAAKNASKTHCPKGHEYSGDNLFLSKKGQRLCRACSHAFCASYKASLVHRDSLKRLGAS